MADAKKVVVGALGAGALGWLAWKLWQGQQASAASTPATLPPSSSAPVDTLPASQSTPQLTPGSLKSTAGELDSPAPAPTYHGGRQFNIVGSNAPVSATTSQAGTTALTKSKQAQLTAGWASPQDTITTGSVIYAQAKARFFVVLLAFFQQMTREYFAGQAELGKAGEIILGVGEVITGIITGNAGVIINGVSTTTSGILAEVAAAQKAGLQNYFPPVDPQTAPSWSGGASGSHAADANVNDLEWMFINYEWSKWIFSLPGASFTGGDTTESTALTLTEEAQNTVTAARLKYLTSKTAQADWAVFITAFDKAANTLTDKNSQDGGVLIDLAAELPDVGTFDPATALGVTAPDVKLKDDMNYGTFGGYWG